MESENIESEGASIWEQLPSCADDRRTYAWRMYRVHDAQRYRRHILAVGTAQSGNLGQERLELVAYRLDTQSFLRARKKEMVCQMSARRSFGVKLTNGFVIIEQESLRSLNIGSLCFNEIVKWALHIAPNDDVEPITLLASHASTYDVENLERRYRFYRQFGIRFAVDDRESPPRQAESEPMKAGELVSHDMSKFPNIDELDFAATVTQLVTGSEELAVQAERLDNDVRRLKDVLKRMLDERARREKSVLRYARLVLVPLLCIAFIAGAVIFHPSHFGIWL
ncbi:hypothetical protein [Ralstonia solanacearum]|uniref:hypothetical protein n=1 Tax=Ralstonia solanacearum TaxID=305 RepID=UPI0018D02610|nr:hypothetical protein [Ralstonia solanacearum]